MTIPREPGAKVEHYSSFSTQPSIPRVGWRDMEIAATLALISGMHPAFYPI